MNTGLYTHFANLRSTFTSACSPHSFISKMPGGHYFFFLQRRSSHSGWRRAMAFKATSTKAGQISVYDFCVEVVSSPGKTYTCATLDRPWHDNRGHGCANSGDGYCSIKSRMVRTRSGHERSRQLTPHAQNDLLCLLPRPSMGQAYLLD